MRIREFSIMRYGPLPNSGRISLHNFNLFWGKNEDGKTLTIDALVKLLLGRNIKDFERIDRVDERPDGYVIVEHEEGKEIKLPEKGDLTKVTDLTSGQCRNIFVIRNSDLSIGHEHEFYTDVTDRLTGLRTKDISKVKAALLGIGKITLSGVFRDIKDEKLKTRVENANELVSELESLAKRIGEERFDKFEEESIKRREKMEGIEQEIKNLEHARKREKYEKGKEALNKLTNAVKEVESLSIYTERDRQLWRDCEGEIKKYGEEKKNSVAELHENEEEFKQTRKKLDEVERDVRVFNERKRILDDELKPELKNYEMELGKVKSAETKNRFYAVAAITSAALSAISILAVILNPSPTFYGLLAFFLASTAVFAILRFSFTGKKAHLAAVFGRIRLTLSRFGLDAENPEEIYSNIQKFGEEYDKKNDELQNVKREKERLEEKIRKLREKTIPDIESKIKDAQEKIDEIKAKAREEFLEEYTMKFTSRQKLEGLIEEQKSILKSHFEKKSDKLEENIPYWDEEIRKLEEYEEKAKDIKYSEVAASELVEKKRKYQEKLNEINGEMVPLQKELEEVQRKANEILGLRGEYLYCKTSVDLKGIKDRLVRFVDENEDSRNVALQVFEIFEEIEVEEREKVSELFGGGSLISKYFNEITSGLYEEVTFDQETSKIEVKRKDGKILEAEKLSGGAYDQLYFSIRLALGEKLLKGKKGFFIMDDPLVKADPDRLQRQIQTLKKISELGWQVIYFSAKKEIKDALEEDIKRDAINYVEVQGIFS